MQLIDNIKRSIQAGIALKNFKAANGMDGRMWSADLIINGVKVGHLVDQGLGHLDTSCTDECGISCVLCTQTIRLRPSTARRLPSARTYQ